MRPSYWRAARGERRIVDGKSVLISSENWSDAAVSKNREASVWLSHEAIATYFTMLSRTIDRVAFFPPLPWSPSDLGR